MKPVLRLTPCAAALLLVPIAAAQAPANVPSVVQVPQPAPRAFAPVTPGPGAPNPAGLPSPIPNPAGLTSRFPAGLPSPLPFPEGLPPVVVPNPPPAGMPPPGGTLPPVAGGGGGAVDVRILGGPPVVPGPYTALQLAQAFLLADANRNGELTRAEASRLGITPLHFDEMDRNKDGVISRSEFEDFFR